MRRFIRIHPILTATIVLALVLAPLLYTIVTARPQASSGPVVVVLTSSWCGTCREVVPVARSMAGEAGAGFVTLDVDSSSAPEEAKAYGITIVGSDLPQIFLSNKGRTALLFNGKGYKFGQTRQLEMELRQKLQNNLQP